MKTLLNKRFSDRCDGYFQQFRAERARGTKGRAISSLVSFRSLGVALLMVLVATMPSYGAEPVFFLIDGAVAVSMPRLTGCEHEMDALNVKLDQELAESHLLEAPTADELRRELLLFMKRTTVQPRIFVICGYAASAMGRLFVLPSDVPEKSDYEVRAIEASAFSRLAGMKESATVLDLHPAGDAFEVAQAAAAWRSNATLKGEKLELVENGSDLASLVADLAKSKATPSQIITSVKTGASTKPSPHDVAGSVISIGPGAPQQQPVQTPTTLPAASMQSISASRMANPDVVVQLPINLGQSGSPLATTVLQRPPLDKASQSTAGLDWPSAFSGIGASASSGQRELGATERHPTNKGAAGVEISRMPTPPASVVAHRAAEPMNKAMRRIQVALLARGLYVGRTNGVESGETRASIRNFQAIIGHPVTGQLTLGEVKLLIGG